MLILVDQDGVLADFERGFVDSWTKAVPDHPAVPVESRKSFFIHEDYPEHLRPAILDVVTAPGFFAGLPPIDGAAEALTGLLEAGHDVRITTSPLRQWRNCVAEKYAWVEQHLGGEWTSRMILTRDKTTVRGDVLIDDKPRVTGALTPMWTHLVYDAPYNRNVATPRLTWATHQQVLADHAGVLAAPG